MTTSARTAQRNGELLAQCAIDLANAHQHNLDCMEPDEQLSYLRKQLKDSSLIIAITHRDDGETTRLTFIRGAEVLDGRKPTHLGKKVRSFACYADNASLAMLHIGWGDSELDHEWRVALRRGDPTAQDRIAEWLTPAREALFHAQIAMHLYDPNHRGPREIQAAAAYMRDNDLMVQVSVD